MTLHELEVAELSQRQQAHYRQCLKNGCTQQMALMLATKHGPEMKNSDRAFSEGARRRMSNMDPKNRDAIQELAHRAGINTSGKYYVGGLGKYADPTAWVATADDVLTVAKKKNLDVSGVLNHKAINKDPPPPAHAGLAPDLIAERVEARYAAKTGVAATYNHIPPGAREKLAEEVVAVHGRRPKL